MTWWNESDCARRLDRGSFRHHGDPVGARVSISADTSRARCVIASAGRITSVFLRRFCSGWRPPAGRGGTAFGAVGLGFVLNAGFGVHHAGVEWGWWAGPAGCSGAGDLTSDASDAGGAAQDRSCPAMKRRSAFWACRWLVTTRYSRRVGESCGVGAGALGGGVSRPRPDRCKSATQSRKNHSSYPVYACAVVYG